jgi:hypothetical protein
MDPYLEGSVWMSVHGQLTAEIARQLAPQLRPRYVALMTKRFVMAEPESVEISEPVRGPDGDALGIEEAGSAAVQNSFMYGSSVRPIRYWSMPRAAWRPSLMAQTTRLWPRRMSPAAKTPSTLLM